jgi:hypothetical protein
MQCVYKMEIVVRNSRILEMCVRAAWGARGTSADNTLEVAGRRGLSSTRRSLCACLLSLYRTLTYSSSLHRQQQQPPPSRE